MTTNTGGYKNKVGNVGTSLVDGDRDVASKNIVYQLNIVQQTLLVRVEKRIHV